MHAWGRHVCLYFRFCSYNFSLSYSLVFRGLSHSGETILDTRSRWWLTTSDELSGNSSAGRAQPCQGWGRGFESRFPLIGWVAEWLCSGLQSRGRRFDSDPSLQSTFLSPGGGIGRRYGLKIRCPKGRAGSSPAPGTTISM